MSACGGGSDSTVTIDDQSQYAENGLRLTQGPTHVLYPPSAPLSTADYNSIIYNPPPEGLEPDNNLDSAEGMRPQRFATNIIYTSAGQSDGIHTCAAFPANAQAAVQQALNIWSSLLNSPVPIEVQVCWTRFTNASYLGALAYGSEAAVVPNGNIDTPVALANALAGFDRLPTQPDLTVTINSSIAWNFSPTVVPPQNQFDLTTVLLHEFGHALGFNSAIDTINWRWKDNRNTIYDTFLRDAQGNALTNRSLYPTNTNIRAVLQSNNVGFVGANAVAANGGRRVNIHSIVPNTPTNLNPNDDGFSNITHLDDLTYGALTNTNRLMTTMINFGDRNHHPGPITVGIMKDLGWARVVSPTAPIAATLRSPSGMFTTGQLNYQWNRLNNASDYLVRVVNTANNGVVLQQWIMASSANCSTGICSLSPSTSLGAGTYRWDVQAKGAGGTGPWSSALTFIVNTATTVPPTTILVSPTGTTTARTPTYTWRAATSATDYYIQIMNRANNATVFQSWLTAAATNCATGTTCTYRPSTTLAVGNYTWRIIAKNARGNAPSSAFMNFTVQ